MTASRDLFIDDSSQKGSSKSSRLLFLIGLGALVVGIGSGIGIGWAIRGDSSDAAQEEITLEFDPFDFIDENTDNKTIQGSRAGTAKSHSESRESLKKSDCDNEIRCCSS